MRLPFASVATLFTVASILVFGGAAQAAGSATFSAAASPSSLTVGATTTFALYENGTDINVVTGTFSYDSSKLQFISTSCAGSFSATANTSSSVASCFVPGGANVSGSQLFANVTFKSIAAGNATLTITGSQIASAGVNTWNEAASSAFVTINPVVVSPTPTATPTVQPTATPTPAKTTPAPKTQVAPTATPVTTATKATTTPTPTITTSPTSTEGQVKGVQASSSATPTPTATPSPMVESSHSQTPWIVGIVVIIVAAIGAYFWLFRNKKA